MAKTTFSGPVVSENGSIIGSSGTQLTQVKVYTPSLDVASVAATTVADQTFTVSGLTTADTVFVNPPALTAGLLVTSARVSAADTLQVRFHNTTAVAVDEAAAVWRIVAVRS
jgi:hypothetical protein